MKKSGCVLFVKKYAIVQSVAGLKNLNLWDTLAKWNQKFRQNLILFGIIAFMKGTKRERRKRKKNRTEKKRKEGEKGEKKEKKQEKNKKSENEDDEDSNNKDNESEEDSEKVPAVKEKLDKKTREKLQ